MCPEASSVNRGVGHSGGPGRCLSRNFQAREGTSEATPGLRALTSYGSAPGTSSAEAGSGEGHLSASCQLSANTETSLWRGAEGAEGLGQGTAGEAVAGPWAALTLQVASAVAARVDPGRAVIADAPHHTPAAGLHHPQVASHLPPEPGRRREAVGGAVPLPWGPGALGPP